MNSARSSANPSDRRNHRRKNLEARQIPVDLGISGGVISDLSESGACVRTAPGVKLEQGERLHFAVPDGLRPIQATCELAWATHDGQAGVRFLVLSERSQQHIKEWLMNDDGTGETIWIPAPAVQARVANKEAPATQSRPILAPQTVAPAPAAVVTPARPPLAPPITTKPVEKHAEAKQRLAYALKLMAELTQLLTSADGAAIALREGEDIVCIASTGSAPGVGVRVQADTGLTRECLRSGLTVRADDTQNDPRVDAEACRALGIRSIVVVPLFSQGNTVGVLQVLSGKAAAFAHTDVLQLPQIAEMIMRLAEKKNLPAPEQSSTNPVAAKTTSNVAETMDATSAGRSSVQLSGASRNSAIDEPDGQPRIQLAPGAKAVWPKLMS